MSRAKRWSPSWTTRERARRARTASATSSGVPWKSVMDRRSPVAYPAVWTMPGRTVEAYTLKWAVRSYNGTVLSWTRRIPSWWSCCHWTYMDSAVREAAIRSAARSPTPQASHQARMSASEGTVLARAMREAFDLCQPHRTASSCPVSPASRRIPSRRAARALRAARAVDRGDSGMNVILRRCTCRAEQHAPRRPRRRRSRGRPLPRRRSGPCGPNVLRRRKR